MGFPVFSNQCAIRMGVALRRAGVQPAQISGCSHCSVHPREEMHFINASQLANAIARANIAGVGRIEKIHRRRRRPVLSEDFRPHGHHLHSGLLAPLLRSAAAQPATTSMCGTATARRAKWLMEWFSWIGYYSNYAGAGEIWFWEVQ